MFGDVTATKALLLKLDACQLTSPAALISKIQFIDYPCDEPIEALFQSHLAHYLRGVGHPAAPPDAEDDFVSAERRQEDAQNIAYRAQRFLEVSTGSDILSTQVTFRLQVL